MNSKERKNLDWAIGIVLGVIGLIFYLSFAAVDAYMFGISPPAIMQKISNLFFLNPLWLDLLSTVFLVLIVALMILGRPKKKKVRS
jgi:cell shape-determining protein MreD